MASLSCGCCGRSFEGRQHWNWDKGFGRCLACILQIIGGDLGRCDDDDKAMYLAGARDQWPDQWGDA